MRLNIIKQLFIANLLYINPLQTKNIRKKANGKYEIKSKLIRSNLFLVALNFILVLFVFGPLSARFSSAASYKFTLLMFTMFTALQLSTSILNMFYETRDTLNFMPLPITEKELFFSKLLTLFSQTISMSIAIIITNFIITFKYGDFSVVRIIITLVYSVAFIIIVHTFFMLIFSSITLIPNFEKHKSKINGITIVFGILVAMSYFSLNSKYNSSLLTSNSYAGDFFFNTIAGHNTYESLINLAIFVTLAIILLVAVDRIIIKNYFTKLYKMARIEPRKLNDKKKQEVTKKTTLRSKLIKRNLKLFSDGTLIANSFTGVAFGCIMLGGLAYAFRQHANSLNLDEKFIPLAITVGACSAIFMFSTISFSAVSMSLEKESFYLLKTLPFDFKKYLKLKLNLALVLQILIALPFFIGILIYAKLTLVLILIAIISFILAAIALGCYFFASDYKNLHLTWTNIMELATRGMNQGLQIILFFVIMIVIAIINVITFILIHNFPSMTVILSIFYFLLVLVALLLCLLRVRKIVWNDIK